MNIRRVVPSITSLHLEESVRFYTDFLGFNVAMDMGWIVTLCSPTNETAQINLLRSEEPSHSAGNVTVSIEVEEVDKLYNAARSAGYTITYRITTEPWGVRRFFVIDPNGVTINIMNHHG